MLARPDRPGQHRVRRGGQTSVPQPSVVDRPDDEGVAVAAQAGTVGVGESAKLLAARDRRRAAHGLVVDVEQRRVDAVLDRVDLAVGDGTRELVPAGVPLVDRVEALVTSAATMLWSEALRRSGARPSMIGAISSSGSYSRVREIVTTDRRARPPGRPRQRGGGIVHQLQHPDEVRRVDAVVAERQPIDVGERNPVVRPGRRPSASSASLRSNPTTSMPCRRRPLAITPVPTPSSTTSGPTIHGARSSAKWSPRRSPPRVSS